MRSLQLDELDMVHGGDNPGLGPYNTGAFFTSHQGDGPADTYLSFGWGDASALVTVTALNAGITAATPGLGIPGAAAKFLGKSLVSGATDEQYNGSLMKMEGFSFYSREALRSIMV